MRKFQIALIAAIMALPLLWGCSDAIQQDDAGSVVDASKILKKIRLGKSVCISGKTIKGSLDFTQSLPCNNKLAVSAVYIPVEICFRNCVFEDTVAAYYAGSPTEQRRVAVFDRNVVFEECEFASAIQMQQADFRGRMDFDLSKVSGEADFSGAHFRNGCSFSQANFGGQAFFVSCNFEGKSKFFKSLFKEAAIFQHCGFMDAANFVDSYFYGGAEFDDMLSMSAIDFTNAKFIGNASISGSRFWGNLRLVSCKFSKSLCLSGNTFAGNLDLRKSQLGKNLEAGNNNMVMSPITAGLQGLDSCNVAQQGNRLIESNIIQLF